MISLEMVARLRLMLAETIAEGETESDTLFTEEELRDLLVSANEDVERAAYEGWRVKAGKLAGLVDITEGAASRKLSDLYKNALEMTKVFSKTSAGPTEGRTRIGRIRRDGPR